MDTTIITIYPAELMGKKTTQKGVPYWQIVDKAKRKYRFYDEGLYNRVEVGQSYEVEVSDFTGSFTNEKGKNIEYTITTIHNILSVPLSEDEPLDKVLMENDQLGETDSGVPVGASYSKTADSPDEVKPDWDAIARGKVRNSVASAVISQLGLVELDDDMTKLMEQWVDYIMGDK